MHKLSERTRARILELKENRVSIGYSAKLVFKPAGPIDINVDYSLLYVLSEACDEKAVKAHFNDLLYPAIARTSTLIAFLTGETGLLHPLITPPVFREEAAASLKK